MYLISVYFDEKTNKIFERYIDRIARQTGNLCMVSNHVPPHMTISSIEARGAEVIQPSFESLQGKLQSGTVQFVSVGQLLPYVFYATPVLNSYLQELSNQVYEAVRNIDGTAVSKYYRPLSWLPHVTLGKTLNKEQMQIAFQVMQESFSPFEGTVTEIGLAKVNPHEDLVRFWL